MFEIIKPFMDRGDLISANNFNKLFPLLLFFVFLCIYVWVDMNVEKKSTAL